MKKTIRHITNIERYNKSYKVKLQVKLKDGKLYLVEDDTELLIEDNSYFEIIIDKKYMLNKSLQPQLTKEGIIKLLPKEETLLVELFPNHLDKNDKETQAYVFSLNKDKGKPFAEIKLLQDLNLEIKNFDKSRLRNCKCYIPFLKIEADSLNQAYSIISTHLEKTRKSHSGNVFNLIYYKSDKGKFKKLDNIRNQAIWGFHNKSNGKEEN